MRSSDDNGHRELTPDLGEARAFLKALGKTQDSLMRGFFPKLHPEARNQKSGRKGKLNSKEAAEWQESGRNVYLVINHGGNTDLDIIACVALFAEFDDRPIEDQLAMVRRSGLPEPTLIVDSGNRSGQFYWTLAEPITRERWRKAQERLILLLGSDPAIKNPSRVMRLPGFWHLGWDPVARRTVRNRMTRIIGGGGNRSSIEALEELLPPSEHVDKVKAAEAADKRHAAATKRGSRSNRSMADVERALACVDRRVPGTGTRPLYLRLLAGMVKACQEAGGTAQDAITLMANHSPQWERADIEGIAAGDFPSIGAGSFWHLCGEAGFDLKRQPESSANRPGRVQAPSPEVYYHEPSSKWFVRDPEGSFIRLTKEDLRMHLASAGIRNTEGRAQDQFMVDHQLERSVVIAQPVCGLDQGLHTFAGQRVLVTKSPRKITPRKGDWPTIKRIFEGLVGEELSVGTDQLRSVYGWIKIGLEAFLGGRRQPGQALVIAGPRDCGKTLLVERIIKPLFGGRSADPFRYMAGKTEFNADLAKAELLFIDDKVTSWQMKDRVAFGGAIKQFTVSTESVSIHPKGQDAVTIPCWWRLVICLNSESEDLLVLPPFGESVGDKIILLHARQFEMPMDTSSAEARKAMDAQLESELPAFAWWLVNEFRIEQSLLCRRFIAPTWHHPGLLRKLNELSPESELLALIDEVILTEEDSRPAPMRARAIWKALVDSRSSMAVASLVKDTNATSRLLDKLAKSRPDRVIEAGNDRKGFKLWQFR